MEILRKLNDVMHEKKTPSKVFHVKCKFFVLQAERTLEKLRL